MSTYVALAVKKASLEDIQSKIKVPFFVDDASSTPIGHMALDSWTQAGCVFLFHSRGVVRLIGQPWVRWAKKGRPRELPAVLEHLVKAFDCEVAFIVHEFRGFITEEMAPLKREVSIHADRVGSIMDQLEEDVRYIVFPAVQEGFNFITNAHAIKGDLKGELAEWKVRIDEAIKGSTDESESLQAIRSTLISLLRTTPGPPSELANRVRDYVRTSNLVLFYPPERDIE